jgi:hydrogenase maturation protease
MIGQPGQILVAGIGNIFLGDDAFGVDVAHALARTEMPPEALLVDFGIRGLDLAYALVEPWRAVILIDAIARGGVPGDLYVVEPSGQSESASGLDPHAMDPLHVLAAARSVGEITAPVFIVGCEPFSLGDELEGRMGLSAVAQRSIPEAVEVVHRLLARLIHGRAPASTAIAV